ncbi:hypothetical protein [Herbidospora cretacea]|uniref:hypothetical protein n=1 Tax=Herbidospora cretacea TaxID=28444 RepID=UPI000774A8E6|nr:hypothetical protein [Herbidospora cretacea]
MGYELRVERESPLAYAELVRALSGHSDVEVRGSAEAGEVVARHGDEGHQVAVWSGRLTGSPASDWHLAHLARVAELLGGRLVGEDGETYGVRDGILEQGDVEFGKVEDLLYAGPTSWSQ